MQDYLRDLISWALLQKGPSAKYDHTASSGGLWLLSGQRLQQQGADKEMHIADNSQTLTLFIWWHQLYLGCVFGHV